MNRNCLEILRSVDSILNEMKNVQTNTLEMSGFDDVTINYELREMANCIIMLLNAIKDTNAKLNAIPVQRM